MKRFLSIVLLASLAFALVAAPSALAGKKKAATKTVTFEESGTIAAPAVTGVAFGGITTMEFVIANACATPPVSQGFDGHIVELPAEFRMGTATIEVLGSDPSGAYDLDVYFYDAGCALMEPYMREGTDPSGAIPPGATWAAVELFVGAGASFDLKATAKVPATR